MTNKEYYKALKGLSKVYKKHEGLSDSKGTLIVYCDDREVIDKLKRIKLPSKAHLWFDDGNLLWHQRW